MAAKEKAEKRSKHKAEEEVEIVEPEEERKIKKSPKLSSELKAQLELRASIASRRPKFRRQEWFRYKKFGRHAPWRVPRGGHSKMRRHYGYRPNVVSIGYRGPEKGRYYHPSGFREVLVHNVKELMQLDPDINAARIAHTVGTRKRIDIQRKAEELGIRILNPFRT